LRRRAWEIAVKVIDDRGNELLVGEKRRGGKGMIIKVVSADSSVLMRYFDIPGHIVLAGPNNTENNSLQAIASVVGTDRWKQPMTLIRGKVM
jgi:hypothetical protein